MSNLVKKITVFRFWPEFQNRQGNFGQKRKIWSDWKIKSSSCRVIKLWKAFLHKRSTDMDMIFAWIFNKLFSLIPHLVQQYYASTNENRKAENASSRQRMNSNTRRRILQLPAKCSPTDWSFGTVAGVYRFAFQSYARQCRKCFDDIPSEPPRYFSTVFWWCSQNCFMNATGLFLGQKVGA